MKVGKLRLLERQGEREIEEFIDDGHQAKVRVSEALDQVESDAATEAGGPDPQRRLHLFISYAHVDEKALLPFRQHLTLLGKQGFIQEWHDRNLVAGEKWEAGILEELNKAELVLFFYTTAAWISDFIKETELPIALDRSDKGECAVIWVPLDRNEIPNPPPLEKRLKALQCATRDARKIHSFKPRSDGWKEVEASICKAVEKRRQGLKRT